MPLMSLKERLGREREREREHCFEPITPLPSTFAETVVRFSCEDAISSAQCNMLARKRQ